MVTVNNRSRGAKCEWSPEIEAEQLRYYKLQVDFADLPQELVNRVDRTPIMPETVQEIVRYAHERLAAVHKQANDLEKELDKRKLFGVLRGNSRQVEVDCHRAEHCGDEAWIRSAEILDLTHEARLACWERKVIECSVTNLRGRVEGHDDVQALRAAGRIYVYEGPTDFKVNNKRRPNSNSTSPESTGSRGSSNRGGYRGRCGDRGGRGGGWRGN